MAEKQGPPPAYTQPPITQTAPPQHQSGGFLSSLNKSLNQLGSDIGKAVDDVTSLSVVERLRPGNVVELQSKICSTKLRILENGSIDCYGQGGTSCQFLILQGQMSNTIRLQNMAMPQNFVGITKGYLIGYGRGGDDCEFYATISPNGQHVIFESAKEAGSHIGALPSGQITAPAQTTKGTDASHFFVRFVRKY